jgi:glycosyltransferase involved in cell wall biosynthesis
LPLQIQIHTDVFSPYFWRESFLNKIRVLLAKFLLPKADGIRVVSERIKQSLTAKNLELKAEPVVLPIFVDTKKIQSAKIKTDLHKKYPGYDFIILMASRLTKEKNIGLAIEAMKEILSAKRLTLNPLLLLVGDGPEENNLKSKSSQLKANVAFEPWTTDLASYYKTADLFLLTSNYEGYGRTVIEAMAAGCPVVMTDVGLAGELLIDELDGLMVPVGDKAALAGAIYEIIENKEKKSGLIAESQKVINSLPEKKEYLENYRKYLELCV